MTWLFPFARGVRGVGGGSGPAGDQRPAEAHDPEGPMAHLLQRL